jgi:hypothetical protein
MTAWEPMGVILAIASGNDEVSTCTACGAREGRVTPGRENRRPYNDMHMGAA